MAIDFKTDSPRRARAVPDSSAARAAVLPRPRGEVSFRRAEPEGRLLRIRAYWLEKRGARRWPARADIDPVEIPDLLPEIILLDAVGTPPRFRKRLVGSSIVEKEGVDSTGRWLDESLNPAIRDEVVRQHHEAAEAPEGNCYTVAFAGGDGKHYSYQRLLLPLSSDGRRVDMLFGGARFLPATEPSRRIGSARRAGTPRY